MFHNQRLSPQMADLFTPPLYFCCNWQFAWKPATDTTASFYQLQFDASYISSHEVDGISMVSRHRTLWRSWSHCQISADYCDACSCTQTFQHAEFLFKIPSTNHPCRGSPGRLSCNWWHHKFGHGLETKTPTLIEQDNQEDICRGSSYQNQEILGHLRGSFYQGPFYWTTDRSSKGIGRSAIRQVWFPCTVLAPTFETLGDLCKVMEKDNGQDLLVRYPLQAYGSSICPLLSLSSSCLPSGDCKNFIIKPKQHQE